MRDFTFTAAQAGAAGFDRLMAEIGPGDADIRLEKGAYYTEGDRAGRWVPRSGWRIRGIGNEASDVTIALRGTLARGTKYHVLGTSYDSVCGFRLENLTLDCGFKENAPAWCNHSGLVIRGSGNLVRGVRVVNWGSRLKGAQGECFGIGLMAVQFSALGNAIEHCSVIEPGGADTVTGCTGILHSATPPYQTVSPSIRHCSVSNASGNDKLYSNGMTIYHGLRSAIENCYVADTGAGVYMDDAGGQDLAVRSCHFERVRRGVSIAFYKAGTRLDALTIEGNRIQLIRPQEGAAFGIEANSFRDADGLFQESGFGIIRASGNEVLAGGDGLGCILAAVRGADLFVARDNIFISDNPVTPLIGRANGKVLLSRNLLGQGELLAYFDELKKESLADPK